MPYTLAAARPESGTRPRGKKQERHIGPIDSDMPEQTHSEGALIFVGSEVAHKVALTLATVRRSNVVCGFPAPRFHEDTNYEIRRRPYRVGPAPHLSG
jgi:hypothetical protein